MALPCTNDLAKARETLKQIESRKSTGTFSGSDRANTQEKSRSIQASPSRDPTGTNGRRRGHGLRWWQQLPRRRSANNLIQYDRQIDTMRAISNVANMFQARAVLPLCARFVRVPRYARPQKCGAVSEGFSMPTMSNGMTQSPTQPTLANVSIYVIDPRESNQSHGAGSRPPTHCGRR